MFDRMICGFQLKCIFKMCFKTMLTRDTQPDILTMVWFLLHHYMLYLLCTILSCFVLCTLPIFPVDVQHLYPRLVLTFMLEIDKNHNIQTNTHTTVPHTVQTNTRNVDTQKQYIYVLCIYVNSRYFSSIDSLYRTMTQIVNFQ